VALTSDPDARELRVFDLVWRMTIQFLDDERSIRGVSVLTVLVHLAGAGVPLSLLLDPVILGTAPNLDGITGAELWDTIRALQDLHLADLHGIDLPDIDLRDRRDPQERDGVGVLRGKERVLSIHPLVRAATRRHLIERPLMEVGGYLEVAVALVHNAIVEILRLPDEILQWPAWRRVEPHSAHLIRSLAALERAGTAVDPGVLSRAAHAGSLAARSLHVQGLYDVAGDQFEVIYGLTRRVLGERHPETLRSSHYLAVLQQARGQHADAYRRHEQVYFTRREVLGLQHPETLRSRHYWALTMHALGDLERAEREYWAVREARGNVLGPTHAHTLASWHNIARVHQDRGELQVAEREYRRILGIMCTHLGPDFRHSLATRHNLAMVLHAQARLDEAEAEYRFVRDAESRLLGPNHPFTLSSRYNLARLLLDRGPSKSAEDEINAVHEIQKRILGPDHPDAMATSARRPGTARSGPL
jgi:tetratricopeptide (TPR) repeat protein